MEPFFCTDERGSHWCNYPAHVLLVSCYRGDEALAIQARDSAVAGFIEIGHAPVLAEILGQAARAQEDPAAASIRADLGQGPSLAFSAPQAQEIGRPPESRRRRAAVLDLEEFERRCVEDDALDSDTAALRLSKVALARQFRESSSQQLALLKRQKVSDVEKHEAEAATAIEKIQVERDRIQLERDRIQVERARVQAEKQEEEDKARADREERDRDRVHSAELATEKRRAEIERRPWKGTLRRASRSSFLPRL